MTAEERLATAIADLVVGRLSAGLGFLRVPEIVSPFPIADLLKGLWDHQDVRFAVFLPGVTTDESERMTTHVHEAIRWRNDPTVADSLVIIGDLERDRAAGLASVP